MDGMVGMMQTDFLRKAIDYFEKVLSTLSRRLARLVSFGAGRREYRATVARG